MDGCHLSEQARQALRAARTLARQRQHTSLGPGHLLAAIVRQWDDAHAAGPALLRACGLTAEQAAEHSAVLLRGPRLDEAPGPDAEPPPPNRGMRVVVAQAYRIAVQARAPYVGTEHLVVAAFWGDYAQPLRLQGITYAQAAQQLTRLPHTEQVVDDGAIEPLTALAVPTPAAASLADTARLLAELHPIQGDGRVSTLHYLLALSRQTGAATLLRELGVSYRALVERLAADGARLVQADDQRPEEPPLEGWEAFEVTPQQHETITGRLDQVLGRRSELRQQGVRFATNWTKDQTRYWVHIHTGTSGLTARDVLDRLLGRAS